MKKRREEKRTGPYKKDCKEKDRKDCVCKYENEIKRQTSTQLHNLLVCHQDQYKSFKTPSNKRQEDDLSFKKARIGALYFIELRFGTKGEITKYGLYDPGADSSHMRKYLISEIRDLEDKNVHYTKKTAPWKVTQAYDASSDITHECSIPVSFTDDPTTYKQSHGWNESETLVHPFIAGKIYQQMVGV